MINELGLKRVEEVMIIKINKRDMSYSLLFKIDW